MAVPVLDTSTTNSVTSGSSSSFSYTCTGSNLGLMVMIMIGRSGGALGQTVTGVTYNSVSLTDSGLTRSFSTGSDTGKVYLFYMIAPPSGAHTLAVSFSASLGTGVRCTTVPASFTGCDQVALVGGTAGSAAGAPTEIDVTTTRADSLVVGHVGWYNGGLNSWDGTQLQDQESGPSIHAQYKSATTVGINFLSWDFISASPGGAVLAVEVMSPAVVATIAFIPTLLSLSVG